VRRLPVSRLEMADRLRKRCRRSHRYPPVHRCERRVVGAAGYTPPVTRRSPRDGRDLPPGKKPQYRRFRGGWHPTGRQDCPPGDEAFQASA
jgi:hypothetical protein